MTHRNRRADRVRNGIRSVLVATDFSDGAGLAVHQAFELGVATGAVAAIMLVSGGDHALEEIQNLTFLASVPFALIMVLMRVSRGKDPRTDGLIERRTRADDLLAELVESEDLRRTVSSARPPRLRPRS